MLSTKIAENKYHEVTKHSYRSVAIDPNYVDASTQPVAFKFYPKFYRRFPLADCPFYDFIRLTSAITFNKVYRDGSAYLRVNPSAGALYPTEIYVQLRGVKGTIDGIYHLEFANKCLTLIYELIDDGIEAYILPNYIVKGAIFLVSCVYYRSSWKYKNRSLRYCFLDSGHHLGAIEAAAYLYRKNLQIVFDFDKLTLNEDLGFENKEWITASAIAGELKEKSVRRLRSPIPFVCGTDYFEPNAFVEAGYRDTVEVKSDRQLLLQPQFNYESERFLATILNRRSARRFTQKPISLDNFFEIVECLKQPIPTESFEELEIYLVVNRVEGMVGGVYRLEIPPTSLEKGGNPIPPTPLKKGAIYLW
jgi:SagB-type dehydrogenase family enzyme